MEVLDYDNSYITWGVSPNLEDTRKPGHMPWGNEARILVEARCELVEEASGRREEFFMGAACRTEWMYRDDVLFQVPNREYRGVWSQERHMSLGMGMVCEEGEVPPKQGSGQVGTVTGSDDYWVKKSGLNSETFNYVRFTLRHHPQVTVLEHDEAVVRGTMQGLPLVARTELRDTERGVRAILEYPIRTMNFHSERRRFQVDTGPLVVPDFRSRSPHWIEWLDIAHVAYNTFDRAEFIIRRPTPVVIGGKEVCRVHHYSEVRVHEVQHTLVCVGELS